MILYRLADCFVAPARNDRETGGGLGIDRNEQIHRQSSSIERGSQIGRGRWEGQMERGWATALLALKHSGGFGRISQRDPRLGSPRPAWHREPQADGEMASVVCFRFHALL